MKVTSTTIKTKLTFIAVRLADFCQALLQKRVRLSVTPEENKVFRSTLNRVITAPGVVNEFRRCWVERVIYSSQWGHQQQTTSMSFIQSIIYTPSTHTHSHTRTHTHTFMTSVGSSWERRKLLIHTNEDTKSGRKLKTRRRKIGFIFGVHAGVFIYRNWVMTKNTRSEEGVRWKCLSPDYCDQFLHYLYIPKILEFLLDNVGLKSNSEVLLLTISCYIKHLHHCISGANTVLVTLK